MGTVKINVGNGNRIGNSRIIDELKKIPSDSIIDFDKLNLDLFKDLNFEISNHLEITNGLSVGLGFMFHRRTPAEHPEESFRQVELPENVAEGLQANIRPQYNSFAPRIRMDSRPILLHERPAENQPKVPFPDFHRRLRAWAQEHIQKYRRL